MCPARSAVVAGRAPDDGPGTADGGIILAGHSVGSQSHSSGQESATRSMILSKVNVSVLVCGLSEILRENME